MHESQASPDSLADVLPVTQDAPAATVAEAPGSLGTITPGAGAAAYDPSHSRSDGRYVLQRICGEGGLGRVWQAVDRALQRDVALKEIKPERQGNAALQRRFLQEAQINSQLDHPNILPVYDLSRQPESGLPFYVMRLVRGQTLQETIRAFHKTPLRGRYRSLAFRQLLQSFVAVCDALAYAHSKGVIHRDLKPQNVLVGDFGEVQVLDWGLAKKLAATTEEEHVATLSEEPLTQLGQVVGTLSYAAPEQARGEAVDVRSDVFGLGAILFEILTNRAVYVGKDVPSLLAQASQGAVPAVRSLVKDVPASLAAVCAMALASNPAQRYATAQALAEDVKRWLADEPVSAYREPWSARALRWTRHHRLAVAVLAGSGMVTLLALGIIAVLVNAQNATLAANNKSLDDKNQALENANRQERESKERALAANRDAFSTIESMASDEALQMLFRQKELTPAQRRHLETIVARYRQFVANGVSADDPADRFRTSRSLVQIGEILWRLEKLEQAEASYDEARKLLEALVAAHPHEVPYRVMLAQCDAQHATLIINNRDFPRAMPLLQQAIDRWREVVAATPGQQESVRLLALAISNLAEAQLRQGELAPSLAHRREVIALLENFTQSDADRFALATALGNCGAVLRTMRRYDEATALLRRSLDLIQQLSPTGLTGLDASRVAAHFGLILGEVYEGQKKLDEAEGEFRSAVERISQAARENPSSPGVAVTHADCCAKLGELLLKRQDTVHGLAMLERAIAITDDLSNRHPAAPHYRYHLAIYLNSIAVAHLRLKRYDECRRSLQRASELITRLVAEYPTSREYKQTAEQVRINLLAVDLFQGKKGEEGK